MEYMFHCIYPFGNNRFLYMTKCLITKERLTIHDTNVLKGIALILLLIHHLFYEGNMPIAELYLAGHPVVQEFSIWCKVCVSIFVLLSGYGLTLSAYNKGGIGKLWIFYKRRILKLMPNYWFIYFIFVPIGVFIFGRTYSIVYKGSVIRFVLDFLGLHYAVTGDVNGYNPTWWFYGCIIVLYAIFPLLYKFRKYWWINMAFAFFSFYFGSRIPIFKSCSSYVPCFIAGIYLSYIPLPQPTANMMKRGVYKLILLCVISYIFAQRLISPQPILWDTVIASVIVIGYLQIPVPSYIQCSLAFVGKHSFNIFLFHTFIYYYYLRDYIYWTTNPFLIFLTLLTICLAISIVLEWLKHMLGINRILSYLTNK